MRVVVKDKIVLQAIAEHYHFEMIDDYLEAAVGYVCDMLDACGQVYIVENGDEEDSYNYKLKGGVWWPKEALIIMED
jgi:hypothetical protein